MSSEDHNMRADLIDSLLEEKDLWAIYKTARTIRERPRNVVLLTVLAALCVANATVSKGTSHQIADQVRTVADFAANLDGTLLGFLAAGFAVCASISRPALFKKMATTINKQTGLSYLKTNYFLFLRVFAYYIVFEFIFIFVHFTCQSGGLLAAAVNSITTYTETVRIAITRIGLAAVDVMLTASILLIQSFIFNVYHLLVTAIRSDFAEPKRHYKTRRKRIGKA